MMPAGHGKHGGDQQCSTGYREGDNVDQRGIERQCDRARDEPCVGAPVIVCAGKL
jgi:hypothetical protein